MGISNANNVFFLRLNVYESRNVIKKINLIGD